MASLMEELVTTLENELKVHKDMLPVVNQKTQAIISNDLAEVERLTDSEQSYATDIRKLETKRAGIMKNIGVVMSVDNEPLTLSHLIEILDKQPGEQERLKALHKELLKTVRELQEANGHNKVLLEQSLEMIAFNMNLLRSTRIVPGNNYTRSMGQWDMTASQTGMFDAKQ